MAFYSIWSGEKPPGGLITVRGPRFVFDQRRPSYAEVFRNFLLDDIEVSRRKGYTKRTHTSLNNSCVFFDGSGDYAAVPAHASLGPGTQWVWEVRFAVPNHLPDANQSLLWKGQSGANQKTVHFYIDASTSELVAEFETAAATITLRATIAAATGYMASFRRDGTACELFLDGVSQDTGALGADLPTANGDHRLIFGAQANNAGGVEPSGQYARAILSEVRFWNNGVRTDAQIAANDDVELATSDTTDLAHYWKLRGAPNKRIIRDSIDHIAVGNRLNGWMRPCGPVLVDRHYPESCPPSDDVTVGIARGEEWVRFDGIGVSAAGQDVQFTPTAGQQDIINELQGGIGQWSRRLEFVAERTGVLECLADWALTAASDNPACRLEKLADDTIRATARIGGVNQTVTTVATIADCRLYAVDIIRRDVDFRLIVYRMDNDTTLEEVAAAVPAGAGDAVTNGPYILGKQRDNSNPFQGAIGNDHMGRFADGSRAQPRIRGDRLGTALIAIPAKRRGRRITDVLNDVDLTPDCTPTDIDFPDGPTAGECLASVRPNSFGHFQGIYDYQRQAMPATEDTERILISVHDGVIYESVNKQGADLDPIMARRGLSGGRTRLSAWSQMVDDLFHFNGLDGNLVRDRSARWTRNGIIAPLTAPSLAEAAGGSLTLLAEYDYSVFFVDPGQDDTISLPGPTASITLTGSNNRVNLTSIPTSTDPDRLNMERWIYRTQWDPKTSIKSSKSYRIAVISDNTVTTYTDDAADTTLGVPADSAEQDEFGFFVGGVLPVCRFGTTNWGRSLAGGDPENPNRLYYSRAGKPQHFPANYFIDMIDEGTGSPMTALHTIYNRTFVWTERDIWEVEPTDDATLFSISRVVRGIGASGHWGVGVKHGTAFWVNAGQRKIYAWDGQGPPKVVSWDVEPTLETYNADSLRYAFMRYYEYRDLMLLLCSTGTTDDTAEGDEGIPENNRILYYDFARSEFGELDGIDINVMEIVEEPGNERDRLYGGSYMGIIRMYDENENDGYDQTVGGPFTKTGNVAAGSTTAAVNLLDTSGGACTLPTAEDGVVDCPFFLIAVDSDGVESVVAKSRIHYNSDADTVVLQTALSVAPTTSHRWAIGGIHARRRECAIDMDRNVHLKGWLDLTLFHRLEVANAQGLSPSVWLHYFQDGSTTSQPTADELDLTTGAPTTSPEKKVEIWEQGRFFSFELESIRPDQPGRFEGLVARYEPVGLGIETT